MSDHLQRLGLTAAVTAALAPYGLTAGRVSRVDKGLCTVLTADGPLRASWSAGLLAEIAGDATAAPCTGDWVGVCRWPDDPVTIEVVTPRRTSIVRAEAGRTSAGQVLAANVDVVAIVVGLVPEPNLGRVERFLTLAWDSGARPVVILTKSDLVHDADDQAADVRMNALGVEVLACSAVTGEGLERVRALCDEDRTTALIGPSGAGKSSLVNALAGADVLAVRAIRADGKGRHTSARRELVALPGGGVLIDTPGLRGVGLHESGEGLAAVFADIEELAARCRFADCGHASEPDCAVRAALDDATLPVRRYESWLRLQREAAWMTRRAAVRRRVTARHDRGRRATTRRDKT